MYLYFMSFPFFSHRTLQKHPPKLPFLNTVYVNCYIGEYIIFSTSIVESRPVISLQIAETMFDSLILPHLPVFTYSICLRPKRGLK